MLKDTLNDETIDQWLKGKTIENVFTNGKELIIRTKCAHEIHVVWKDGWPRLNGVHVKIVLPMPDEGSFGVRGNLGKLK